MFFPNESVLDLSGGRFAQSPLAIVSLPTVGMQESIITALQVRFAICFNGRTKFLILAMP